MLRPHHLPSDRARSRTLGAAACCTALVLVGFVVFATLTRMAGAAVATPGAAGRGVSATAVRTESPHISVAAVNPDAADVGSGGVGAYTPGEVVVKYAPATPPQARAATARAAGAVDPVAVAAHTRLLHLAPGVTLAVALARLRHRRDVVWAVPDYVAHEAGALIPDD